MFQRISGKEQSSNISDSKHEFPKYEDRYMHFDFVSFPKTIQSHLRVGNQNFADLGCGDGPWFNLLFQNGYISETSKVYAVDLDKIRLQRISDRFPWISTITSSAESIPQIPDRSIDFVISTMVMEHVFDEMKYLSEIHRILKSSGKAYITTVFKKPWAVFYRRRNGEFVLDKSHVREYTDLDDFKKLIYESGMEIIEINLNPIKIPILKPIFRIWKRKERTVTKFVKILLLPKLLIPGYFELEVVLRSKASE